MRRRRILVSTCLAVALTATATTSLAADNGGFKTGQDPRCSIDVKDGVEITPLLTVGDVLRERLPVRVHPGRDLPAHAWQRAGRLYVNHETSKVPFPFNIGNADGGER